MLSGRRCAPFKILPVASRGETKHASSASYHARQSLELRDLPVTLLTEQKKAGGHHLGLAGGLVMEAPARQRPVHVALIAELRQQPCLLHMDELLC